MPGARTVVIREKDGSTWPLLIAPLQCRPYNLAVAAENQLVRKIGAILAGWQN